MTLAFKKREDTLTVIDTGLARVLEGGRKEQDTFSQIQNTCTEKFPEKTEQTLRSAYIDTPLGHMMAISSEHALYLLEFVENARLEQKVEKLKIKMQATIVSGIYDPLHSIEEELISYFKGTLQEFKTPVCFCGSPFQNRVWEELSRIPYGQMRSYAAQAMRIGKPTAYRAVANANGANYLSVIIPCHRIVRTEGSLGGYGGGITRKQWLIDHEKRKMS